MLVPPRERSEAIVEIPESAGQGDGAEIDAVAETGGARFEFGEPARDLGELAGDPVGPAQSFRPHRRLVARENGGVADAIGKRLLHQRAPARRTRARQEVATGQIVQVFADHAAVEENGAVVGDQCRDLAQRVVDDDRPVGLDRVRGGGQAFDAL